MNNKIIKKIDDNVQKIKMHTRTKLTIRIYIMRLPILCELNGWEQKRVRFVGRHADAMEERTEFGKGTTEHMK